MLSQTFLFSVIIASFIFISYKKKSYDIPTNSNGYDIPAMQNYPEVPARSATMRTGVSHSPQPKETHKSKSKKSPKYAFSRFGGLSFLSFLLGLVWQFVTARACFTRALTFGRNLLLSWLSRNPFEDEEESSVEDNDNNSEYENDENERNELRVLGPRISMESYRTEGGDYTKEELKYLFCHHSLENAKCLAQLVALCVADCWIGYSNFVFVSMTLSVSYSFAVIAYNFVWLVFIERQNIYLCFVYLASE